MATKKREKEDEFIQLTKGISEKSSGLEPQAKKQKSDNTNETCFDHHNMQLDQTLVMSKSLQEQNSIMPTNLSKNDDVPKIKGSDNSSQANNIVVKANEDGSQEELLKSTCIQQRKKVALFLSYSGKGYFGMQKNEGVQTIEGDLINVLLNLGVVDYEANTKLGKIKFQRTSKTDKGVSAIRQIVSLKMDISKNYLQDINSQLPEQIKLHYIMRVTGSFNPQFYCSSRCYQYLCPTFSFAPTYDQTYEGYRMDGDVKIKLHTLFQHFKGTHKYHNYTSGLKSSDPKCQRHIYEIYLDEPFVNQATGIEFISIHLRGQSFVLHQIRKMVSMAIVVMRGIVEEEVFHLSLTNERINIPMAPSLGLILNRQHFDFYNRKFGDNGIHEKIVWDKFEDEAEKFCDTYIYPTIFNSEKHEKSMFSWLGIVKEHTFFNQKNTTNLSLTTGQESELLENSKNSASKIQSSESIKTTQTEIEADQKTNIES